MAFLGLSFALEFVSSSLLKLTINFPEALTWANCRSKSTKLRHEYKWAWGSVQETSSVNVTARRQCVGTRRYGRVPSHLVDVSSENNFGQELMLSCLLLGQSRTQLKSGWRTSLALSVWLRRKLVSLLYLNPPCRNHRALLNH